MLRKIVIENLGVFRHLSMEFAPRLNILCGTNGTGKSFLLDSVWFALTHRWPIEPVTSIKKARIECIGSDSSGDHMDYSASFDRSEQEWTWSPDKFDNTGLVFYARADGGLCVADSVQGNSLALSLHEIWNGREKSGKFVCEGLVSDVLKWQNRRSEELAMFEKILEVLSPSNFKIRLSLPTRISLDDVRDIPTVVLPYGNVPVLHTSSGIRRILTLAYCLTWVYSEHCRACNVAGMSYDSRMTFLMDDVEANLHPDWQGSILESIFAAISALRGSLENVQLFVATKSPMVTDWAKVHFDFPLDGMLELREDELNGIVVDDCSMNVRSETCTNQKSQFMSEESFEKVWQKGRIVPDYDPTKFRKDACGAWIARDQYGNLDSEFGWVVDHIYPLALGGGDDAENMRPLHFKNNRSKGDDYPSYKAVLASRGRKNVKCERYLVVNANKVKKLNDMYGEPNF